MLAAKSERRRLRKHGITAERYATLVETQGDRCAICGGSEALGRGGKNGRWHIDHDHSCCPGPYSCGECIRGLLCAHCNVMLGLAGENPEVLEAAALYVRQRSK